MIRIDYNMLQQVSMSLDNQADIQPSLIITPSVPEQKSSVLNVPPSFQTSSPSEAVETLPVKTIVMTEMSFEK